MFNKDKAPAIEKTSSSSATLISAGTTLQGDVKSDTDLRIDGTVHGNVTCASKIIIGPSGFIEGHVNAAHADITGKVVGNITVKELLQLRGNSNVQGNIHAAKLQIDPTAIFNGQCQMGVPAASVVKMSEPDVQSKAK